MAFGIYACAHVSLFMPFYIMFQQINVGTTGKKKYRHLPPVTNITFWIMIASIGSCLYKYEVMTFSLWAKEVNRDIMSHCLNGPTGCKTGCHLMKNSGKNACFFLFFVFICESMQRSSVFVMCSWDTLVVELAGRGRCVMSESVVNTGWGHVRVGCFWLAGLSGFGALDWVDVCHAHVMPSLPDEPCSYTINTIIAWKCIYLICETETVLLDLWCKARFN